MILISSNWQKQLRIHCDYNCTQRARNRAFVLCSFSALYKFFFYQVRNFCFHREMRFRNPAFFQRNGRFSFNLIRGKPRFINKETQFHGEAASVCGSNQFFRVSSFFFFKAGVVCIVRMIECLALRSYFSAPGFAGTIPDGSG